MNFCLFADGAASPTDIASCILFAMLVAYGAIIIIFTSALFIKTKRLGREDAANDNAAGPSGVSVIIPFRNEERNLNALLASIAKQCYKGMIEVVLVNDQSEDNGVSVIKAFSHHNDNIFIKIIDLHPSINTALTSKQQALDLGVENSSHPLLLFTDADMALAPNWVESMVNSHKSTNAAHVFGHTAVTPSGARRSLFTLLESYQLEFLFSFAYAFAKLNLTGSCMGNNVLAAKDAYLKCGGQRGAGYSIVEDRALLALMRKKGFKAAAQEPFGVTAFTYPSQSKKQFLNQMLRWAAGGLRPGGGLFAAGGLMLVQNLMFFLTALGMIAPAAGVMVPTGIAVASIANFVLTWGFLAASFWKNGGAAGAGSTALHLFLYPAYYIFMMAETAVFLPLMVFKGKGGIRWKGRELVGKTKR
ncbi:MAG: glycosyltransferase [Chitinispirillales bacterium]|nr:glycosyltransferase [Chitinispirillales bacterium]